MSEILKFCDPMLILADYKSPERHKHLASHIIISLGGEMKWQIESKNIKCRGICIDSNVVHTGTIVKEGSIIFLFTEISRYASSIKQKHLNGNSYAILNDDVVDRMIKKYENHQNDKETLDEILLQQCGIYNSDNHRYEKRVEEILSYISGLKTIEHSIVDDLSNHIYVSKSRLSHLFREQTGMTLHSYLAFEKLRKTYKYFCEGMNITEACILAGFDSSSHCASTCKRMFGISLRDVYKTIKE
ncbi:helix-turn-helix domain-containing protein [Clostridium botulinum]|uniref:Helix-turn-helix domain-containing protein n=1 Tax=Clostridium botulinum TaxID=1491 RepID=A0A846J1A3_CLOBO|nr:AraC family transcriptional regulator [Clostridium botulinum]ACA56904.1 transcriptional regulator, AraC family protein [Clostridium botulinum A3 str. Loch Maree]NFH64320.1 helix-turn-helix domain-containing protein [Clostridium botulinum]NFJ07101.1 helix-turn-helix domain-containing protein [Clostridium botulinum]NFK14073.1 helix-turn-helix domain-containing protein [Clostridium botulinum]NFM92271.1 helix-turn-helix domain-containing protein [Clostridium botulinum]